MLEEKIRDDYKAAMKARDTLKSSVLSFLRAEMLNTAIAKKKETLDDAEVFSVIKKQIKQREDSIEQFAKGGRLEMAEKERSELALLKSYLPPELSEEEVARLVEEAIKTVGAADMKSMGAVIKEVMARSGGQADGKKVSALVKERLMKGDAHA